MKIIMITIIVLLIILSGCAFEVQDAKECRSKCYKDNEEWEYRFDWTKVNNETTMICECVE